MVDPRQARKENAPGTFFVDDSCIDCDTCRWMDAAHFTRAGSQSAVTTQPETPAGYAAAAQALIACPTASIGIRPDAAPEAKAAVAAAASAFPLAITDRIGHCGYHHRDSFGAASYFIEREDGNVLVDSPRFAAPLVRELEQRGGVKYLYLTHRDDVADHAKFAEHFGCERILHKEDVSAGTRGVEIQLEGRDWIELASDLHILPVPGHTRGHSVLLHGDVLFTGDHLAWSTRQDRLIAFRNACWYSWEEQTASMQRLREVEFSWVLPGHGRRHHANPTVMRRSLDACIAWMRTVA